METTSKMIHEAIIAGFKYALDLAEIEIKYGDDPIEAMKRKLEELEHKDE